MKNVSKVYHSPSVVRSCSDITFVCLYIKLGRTFALSCLQYHYAIATPRDATATRWTFASHRHDKALSSF